MRTITLPGLANVIRGEPKRGPTFPAIQRQDRLPVKEEPTLAPTPVPATAFYGVGRDAMHAWPTIWRYTSTDIAGITSHMAPWFQFPRVPGAMVVGSGYGAMLPVAGRPNIVSEESQSYGAMATLRAQPPLSAVYAKLIGG